MLDSRRDCRYRRGAHRSIGVGLGKVTFHDMLGTSFGVPGFRLTLIQPSAWKGISQKFNFRFTAFYEVRGQACSTASSGTISPGSAVAPVPRTERSPRLLNIANSLQPPL